MDNFSTEFKLECVKREVKELTRSELEQKACDLFDLAQKQSQHIAALNLLIKNLEERCKLLSRITRIMGVFSEF